MAQVRKQDDEMTSPESNDTEASAGLFLGPGLISVLCRAADSNAHMEMWIKLVGDLGQV